jgi:hypothetical protein
MPQEVLGGAPAGVAQHGVRPHTAALAHVGHQRGSLALVDRDVRERRERSAGRGVEREHRRPVAMHRPQRGDSLQDGVRAHDAARCGARRRRRHGAHTVRENAPVAG